ncbi:MAG TPA: MmcQ/YjbR family DNA-binding protein [Candidatus Dormibacteraeota bacterium]|nr:MmcQ/YjbR family DNA-binding protein [Candidatus Dormibacteraeota bacterium]
MTVDQVRKLARAFPGTVEQEHWGNPSFRVRGRIFATVPDDGHVNVMIDPFDAESAVADAPESCQVLLWGKEVRGVQVSLRTAAPKMVEALLRSAWRRKAPKRLLT